MDADLSDDMYRIFYFLTFVVVFCIFPFLFIISNTDLNPRHADYKCDSKLKIEEILSDGQAGSPQQYNYKLSDGKNFTSSKKYTVGEEVCRY